MTQIEYLEAEIMMLRHHLQGYSSFVSPADIQDGCPLPDAIKKRLRELERRRSELLREDR